MQHKSVKKGDNHIIHNFEFETITKRNEFIPNEEDLNKICLVNSPYGFYALKSVEPIEWKILGEIIVNVGELDVYTKQQSNELFTTVEEMQNSINEAKVKGIDYIEATNPTTKVNPTVQDALWINRTSGELFICQDSTKDLNVWKGSIGTAVAPKPIYKLDIFNDNSALKLLELEENTINNENYTNVTIMNMNYINGIKEKGLKAIDASSRIHIAESMRSISFFTKLPTTMPNTDYLFDCRKYGFSALAQLSGTLKISNLASAEIYQNGVKKGVGDQLITNEWTHIVIITSDISKGITLLNYQLESYNYGIPNAEIDHIRTFNRAITSTEIPKLREEIL